ncbi:MAG: D-tyrosyl-tRNA(Tyr) deacylase [Candidatus Peregrinibacteria bacterium GW2011_GWA2_47_7]|nr:MAG: D-tyrosyl-tRNA(Tyr) deacylase [Candidatus Peregrinibacteria bacterium GW2011_GWA2_47_7]
MRVLLQRVSKAEVRVDGVVSGAIGRGLLIFLGVTESDTERDANYLFEKIKNVRLFAEGERHFEKSIVDSNGDILIVSQFTLYGSCEKGRRPDFGEAAPPEHARKLYEYFVAQCRSTGLTVATGIFGAMMEVDLINDGPVTFLIESKDLPPS